MDAVIRGIVIYFFLLLIFRFAGKRSLGQITTFDLVLLLVISEATDNGLLGNDYSLTHALILIVTMVGLDIGLSMWKQGSETLGKIIDSAPLVIVEDGRVLQDRMDKSRVDVSDILSAARQLQGLESMEQIKYAVLERNGQISVVPKAAVEK